MKALLRFLLMALFSVSLCAAVPLTSLNERLISAIEQDRVDQVRTLLAQGADLEANAGSGSTPLLLAVKLQRTAIVKLLLSSGADMAARDSVIGDNPLQWAISVNDLEIVRLLLDRKAALDVRDVTGNTPLHLAATRGELEIVTLLLDRGAALEEKNKNGLTPLLSAIFAGKAAVTRLLFDRGADILATSADETNVLGAATKSNNAEVQQIVKERVERYRAQAQLDNKLIESISKDNADQVQLLLDAGANLEARLEGKRDLESYYYVEVRETTPLQLAVGMNKPNMVKLLLARGAKIDVSTNLYLSVYHYSMTKTDGEFTALTLAIEQGQMPLVQILLAQGANLERRDSEGRTPLLFAIDKGKTDIAKFLLEKGSDPEAKDKLGRAALQHAALSGNVEIGKLLRNGNARYRQLEQAQWGDPREQFSAYVAALADDPQTVILRRKVIALAAGLPAPPAVPDEASLLFQQATQQLQLASTPAAIDQCIALYRKAIAIAPWWANAYYNLSRSLELKTAYEDAIAQMELYLLSNPPEADAAEARTRIAAMRTARNAGR